MQHVAGAKWALKTAGKAGAHVERYICACWPSQRYWQETLRVWLPLGLAIVYVMADDQVAPSHFLQRMKNLTNFEAHRSSEAR